MSKNRVHQYRGKRKREDRKKNHSQRANFERLLFEMRQNKVINIYAKDIKDDHTPTNFYVVAFNLKEPMTFKEFEESLVMSLEFLR